MWFTNRGRQLPKLVQTIIDANTIKAQNSFGVNSNSMQNGGKIRNHLLIFTVLSLPMRGSVYGFIRSTTHRFDGVNSYDPQSEIAQVLITPDAPIVVFIPFCRV